MDPPTADYRPPLALLNRSASKSHRRGVVKPEKPSPYAFPARPLEYGKFYPLADMFITDAVNTADPLWSKIELGTIVLAAQPDLYGAGWWQGAVTERVLTVMLPKEY